MEYVLIVYSDKLYQQQKARVLILLKIILT